MEDSQERKRRKEKSDEYYKERKSRKHSSKSPERHRDRDRDSVRDASRKRRRSRSPKRDERRNEGKMEAPPRKSKTDDMLNTRTGGAYIPPARLRMMQAQITDKSSVAYQRLAWEALKKSIHGHINKINVGNIGIIIKELLKENIVRGRGLLCRSVIQAQAASPTFTNVYAALVAAVNSRFPNIGELLLKRLVIQFKRGFKRNDKAICISSASFVAHLVNQRVAHEILALELLTLLVETPSDDSVEVAIAFLKECGQKLTEVSSKGVNAIFEMLRNILHEGQLDKRVQYMIEVMFQVWKDGFKDHPSVIEELELVPEEEQFTHLLMLDEATDAQDILNVFKFDEKYEDNEQKYKTLSKEILGSDAESGEEEDGSAESGSDESDDEEDEQKPVTIIDNTETNLIALRRTIYLTINSSLDFEECAHKLMKMQLKPGQEIELCHMFLDCCAEQRTYEKFYGLLAQRFCNINRIYIGPFEEIFKDSYATAHRLDTNRLRNISKFFAHLLFTDSISWEALDCVKLNEEDTTSSSRIYIKILFQELAEYMGLKKLNDRLRDQTLQEAFLGIFPRDNPKNTRFSINFFTSIGLGGLTDDLREHLKQMPKNVPAPAEIKVHSDSSSDSSSSSSSSSSDSSSSDSEEDTGNGKDKTKKKGSNAPNSPKDNPGKTSNEEERWGHDGYFERYGREEQRSDREGRSKRGEFARPKDVSKHTKDTQGSNDNFDIKQKNALEKGKTHQKRKEYANKKEINDSDVRCRSDSEQAVKEQTPIYDSYWSSTSRKKGNDSSKDRDDEYRHRDKNSRSDKDLDRDDYKESDKRSEKERNENRSRDKYEKRNHQKSIVNTSSDEQRKFDGNMKSSIKRDSKYQEKLLETSSRNTSRPEKSSHVDRGIIADKGFHSEKGKTDKNKSYKRHYKHNRDVQLTQDEESSDDSQNDSSDEKTYGKHNLKPMGDSDDSKSGRTPEQDSDSRNKRDKYVEKENGEPKIGRYWDSYDTQKSRDSQRQSRHKREIKSRR